MSQPAADVPPASALLGGLSDLDRREVGDCFEAPGADTDYVFSSGQRTAVAGAFKLAGYEGRIVVAPIASEDERAFLVDAAALQSIRHVRTLEQVLQQLLGLKVFVVERRDDSWGSPMAFE